MFIQKDAESVGVGVIIRGRGHDFSGQEVLQCFDVVVILVVAVGGSGSDSLRESTHRIQTVNRQTGTHVILAFKVQHTPFSRRRRGVEGGNIIVGVWVCFNLGGALLSASCCSEEVM